MGFNIKDPRWVALRLEMIGASLDKGMTECRICGRRMWFSDFEPLRDAVSDDETASDCVATLDHLLPLALGGTFAKVNMFVMCKGCNKDKGCRDPVEWLEDVAQRGIMTARQIKRLRHRIKQAIVTRDRYRQRLAEG